MKVRILSFTFVLLLMISVFVIFFFYGYVFFGSFGVSTEDSFALSVFSIIPLVFAIGLIWQRIFLGVAFPPLKQTLLHPSIVFKKWEFKAVAALYLFMVAVMYSDYLNSVASLFSISLTLLSLYVMIVVSEALLYMAKDERVMHPFRREYDL